MRLCHRLAGGQEGLREEALALVQCKVEFSKVCGVPSTLTAEPGLSRRVGVGGKVLDPNAPRQRIQTGSNPEKKGTLVLPRGNVMCQVL